MGRQHCWITLIVAFFLAACHTTVLLTVRNPTSLDHEVRVALKDAKGFSAGELSLGAVSPNQKIESSFEIEHKGAFEISSRLPHSADVFQWGPRTVQSRPDPLSIAVDLAVQGNFLPDSESLSLILKTFRDLGPNVGFRPIPLLNGLKTKFGALLIINTSPNSNTVTTEPLFELTPAQFGSSEVSFTEFHYPETSSSETVEISSSASATASASVPVYGSLGIDTSSEGVYKVSWQIEGFGMVEKPEEAGWNYIIGLNSLSSSVRATILKVLQANPQAKLMYVTRIYTINHARFDVQRARKLAAGAKLEAGSIVTASGAYSFSDSQINHQNVDAAIINIGGPVFTPEVIAISERPDRDDEFKSFRGGKISSEKFIELLVEPTRKGSPKFMLVPKQETEVMFLTNRAANLE